MKIYLINLDKSTDRLQSQHEQFDKLDMTFERVSATSIDDISDDYYQKVGFDWQRPLKKTEVACISSHIKLWEKIANQNEPCVILEDDAILIKNFKNIISDIVQMNLLCDYINLEAHAHKRKLLSYKPIYSLAKHPHELYRIILDKSGTGGYILYPSGAKKLLAHLNNRAMGLADEFIFSCHELIKYQIEPAILLQSDQCQSYGITHIDAHTSVINKNNTQINPEISPSNKLRFKYRRIVGQIKLGITQLQLANSGIKREVKVNPELF